MFNLRKKTKDDCLRKEILPQELDGFVFFIKDIEYNRLYKCDTSCITYQNIQNGYSESCDDCIVKKINGGMFSCTKVLVNVIATTSVKKEWHLSHDNVVIIDTLGFTHKGLILCDEILSGTNMLKSCDLIHKLTKANIVYTFPLLPKDAKIRDIIIKRNDYDDYIKFNVTEYNEDEYNIENYVKKDNRKTEDIEDNSSQLNVVDNFRLQKIQDKLKDLKVGIFKRLNTELTPIAAKRLEEDIETKIYVLELDFTWDKESKTPKEELLFEDFKIEIANYREILYQKKIAENKLTIKLKNVTELINLNPFDFEYLCSKIMERMGYENIKLTPRTHDCGIDIMGENEGKIVVAQCKRYNKKITSSDMQLFIGAFHNAGADTGIFFTTNLFTTDAENMAGVNNIVLIDRIKLIEILSLTDDLVKESSDTPTLFTEK